MEQENLVRELFFNRIKELEDSDFDKALEIVIADPRQAVFDIDLLTSYIKIITVLLAAGADKKLK